MTGKAKGGGMTRTRVILTPHDELSIPNFPNVCSGDKEGVH